MLASCLGAEQPFYGNKLRGHSCESRQLKSASSVVGHVLNRLSKKPWRRGAFIMPGRGCFFSRDVGARIVLIRIVRCPCCVSVLNSLFSLVIRVITAILWMSLVLISLAICAVYVLSFSFSSEAPRFSRCEALLPCHRRGPLMRRSVKSGGHGFLIGCVSDKSP